MDNSTATATMPGAAHEPGRSPAHQQWTAWPTAGPATETATQPRTAATTDGSSSATKSRQQPRQLSTRSPAADAEQRTGSASEPGRHTRQTGGAIQPRPRRQRAKTEQIPNATQRTRRRVKKV